MTSIKPTEMTIPVVGNQIVIILSIMTPPDHPNQREEKGKYRKREWRVESKRQKKEKTHRLSRDAFPKSIHLSSNCLDLNLNQSYQSGIAFLSRRSARIVDLQPVDHLLLLATRVETRGLENGSQSLLSA